MSEGDLPGPSHIQNIEVISGFAYGVIGADLHVFGDGVPVYLLSHWQDAPEPDAQWLRQLPSRLLNARFAVVEFTGREEDLAQLHQWANDSPRLAVRWLHAPGGQGKTRLAARFAAEVATTGWKVVTAVQGAGTVIPPPGSQDLRLGDAGGLLMIVDYADRWPLTHLTWLFSNALLHQVGVKARILLIARSADGWPAVRAALANHQAGTSTHFLRALPDEPERAGMFSAARDSFAARYDIEDPDRIGPPGPLDDPEMSLVLALHMAALVAVDAHAHGLRPPAGMAGLTIYLLDREHQHWASLYGDRAHELSPADWVYRTPPAVMNRVVFTAALTGSLSRPAGARILENLELAPGPDQILTDHGICYPAADPARPTVLEPLYPDRLAEDFLALTLPGHSADYPAQSWAPTTAMELISRQGDGTPPGYLARPLTVLASAAGPGRWPHVATELNTILASDPALAIDAGSPALTALAAAVDISVLAAIEPLLPEKRHVDLDVGAAAVVVRLTRDRLARVTEAAERAGLLTVMAERLRNAGRHQEALEAVDEAITIYRQLADTSGTQYLPALARSLIDLGRVMTDLGRIDAAVVSCEEAVAIYRRLADADPAAEMPDRGTALVYLSMQLPLTGRPDDAVKLAEEAVAIHRKLAKANPAAFLPDLAESLSNLGTRHRMIGAGMAAAAAQWVTEQTAGSVPLSVLGAGRRQTRTLKKAMHAHREAERIRRVLAGSDPAAHLPGLAESLNNLGVVLGDLENHAESTAAFEQAIAIRRRLAKTNPALYSVNLANSLQSLGQQTMALGLWAKALPLLEEALEIRRELARANPGWHSRNLVIMLLAVRSCLAKMGRTAEALAIRQEAVATSRKLAEIEPRSYLSLLAIALSEVGEQDATAKAAEETASIYRVLAEAEPATYLPRLGESLIVICAETIKRNSTLELLRNRNDLTALPDLAEEAVSAYRRLAAEKPDEFTHELAHALRILAITKVLVDEPTEALAAADEAVALFRRLVRQKGQHRQTQWLLKAELQQTQQLSTRLQPAFMAAVEAKLSGKSAIVAAATASWLASAPSGVAEDLAARPFESFAVSFSLISAVTGIFITFGFALTAGGPRSIWTWPVVLAGQALVALVYGALAGRVPLYGHSYRWASRLANVHIGWWMGWMSLAFLSIITVSVDYGLVQLAFQPLIGEAYTPGSAALETLWVLAVQAVLIISSTRVTIRVNRASAPAELVAIIGLSVLLVVVAAIRGLGHWSNLTAAGVVPSAGYYAWLGPFMLATLLGAYTMVGFEGPNNLAEEMQQPLPTTPKGPVFSALISGAFGMTLLIALDYAIGSIPAASHSSAPVAFIANDVLGGFLQRLLLIFVGISIFACGLVTMVTNGRLIWSMARDRRLPGYQLWRQAPTATGGPGSATALAAVIGAAITLVLRTHASALVTLVAASTIIPALLCATTVLLYVFVGRRRRGQAGHFSLGRWEIPVIAGALVWLAYELIILIGPGVFRDAQYYVLGALGLGMIFYFGQWLLEPATMRTEAGTHGTEAFEAAGQPSPSPAHGTTGGGGVP